MLPKEKAIALREILFSHLLSLCSVLGFLQTCFLMRHSQFVTAVYEDFYGIKRPIGMIHLVKIHGQLREVFTFCGASQRQPDMALFVRKRTGNLADDVALSFEEQDSIPAYLKHLPETYRATHLQTLHAAG